MHLNKRTKLAIIVDEYGALMGMISLEDIIEEIVGDISDEHDVIVKGVDVNSDGSFNSITILEQFSLFPIIPSIAYRIEF